MVIRKLQGDVRVGWGGPSRDAGPNGAFSTKYGSQLIGTAVQAVQAVHSSFLRRLNETHV